MKVQTMLPTPMMPSYPKSEMCVRCRASALCLGYGRDELFKRLEQCDSCRAVLYRGVVDVGIVCIEDWLRMWADEYGIWVTKKCPACGAGDSVNGWHVKRLGARAEMFAVLEVP